MRTLATATMGLVLGLLLATQMGTPPSAASGAESEAARLYQQASRAIASKEYRKAAQLFERAYDYDPDPSLLANAAGAHEADLNDVKARILFWRVVNHANATAEQKTAARRNMERVEGKMRRKGAIVRPLPMPEVTTTKTAPPPAMKTTKAPTTTAPTRSPAKRKASQVVSGDIVRVPRPDIDEPYMLSAMHCKWDGPTGRFLQCSSGHAWGGQANFDISQARSRASGHGLTIGFQNTYKGKPYCSVEFQDLAALRRVNAGSSNVTIWLHNGGGAPKNWSSVRTWITVLCHGVD